MLDKWSKVVYIAKFRALLPTPNLGNDLMFIKNKRGFVCDISALYIARVASWSVMDFSMAQ